MSNQYLKIVFISLSLSLAPALQASEYELFTKLENVAKNGWVSTDLMNESDIQKLILLAEKEDVNAQYALGMIKSVKKDPYASAYWLKKSAAQGHLPAQMALQYQMKRIGDIDTFQ